MTIGLAERQILDAHAIELQVIIHNANADAANAQGAELLAARRRMNQALQDKLKEQARVMTFMAGEKVEPEQHFGEAVLLPAGGLGI